MHTINTARCDVGFICGPAHMDVEGNEGGRSRGKKGLLNLGEKTGDGSSSPINKASLMESVNVEKEKMWDTSSQYKRGSCLKTWEKVGRLFLICADHWNLDEWTEMEKKMLECLDSVGRL